MASIKQLKRDLNNVMGDIIEAAYIHQMAHPKEDHTKSDEIIEDAITTFDELIVKINAKEENKAAQLKSVNKELEEKASSLVERVNAL